MNWISRWIQGWVGRGVSRRDEKVGDSVPNPAKPKRSQRLSIYRLEWLRRLSTTGRTRDRKLQDLSGDSSKLEKYKLPVWNNDLEVATALGVSRKELWFYASHRYFDRFLHYVTFRVPKRSGGERLIMAPKRRLKALQRRLLTELVEKLPVSDRAHAFRVGRNIRSGAAEHVGKQVVIKMDLKDFFPSVTFGRVRGFLIAYGYGYDVATTLAALMTECERQSVESNGMLYYVPVGHRHCVQGAPTSPGICNALFLGTDQVLTGLSKKRGLSYTRYADDLCFSGAIEKKEIIEFIRSVEGAVARGGFTVNRAKTRVMGQGTRQQVTGVVVNAGLGMSRKERRKIRATIHRMKTGVVSDEHVQRVQGQVAFAGMLNAEQGTKLLRRLKAVIKGRA